MGSEPNRLIKTLKYNPDSLAWSIPREVQVVRGSTGKLGLRFQTVQCFPKGVSNTVVLAVWDSCIVRGGELHKLDRIHKINGFPLTNKTEDEVDAIFQNKDTYIYNLEVQSEFLKRDHLSDCVTENSSEGQPASVLSGYSGTMDGTNRNVNNNGIQPKRLLSHTGSAGKTSVSSVERPSGANKRFMKSNSSEQEESGHQLTSASINPHPLAPSVNGYIPNSGVSRMHSMPDPLSDAEIGIEIEDGERIHSLPAMNVMGRQIGTFHGCDNGVGTVKPLKPGRMNIRPCPNRNCHFEKEGCLWHSLIFKVPQFVVWEPMSKTVTLNRGDNPTFGFDKKVKLQEATGDIYALVESVAPGTVAEEYGLYVGDWIRSINGKALQSKDEARHTKFDHFTEIRLVIQRPQGILDKAQIHVSKIKQELTPLKMPQRRHLPSVYSPPSPVVHPATSPRNIPLHPNILPPSVRQVSPMVYGQVMSPVISTQGQEMLYTRGCTGNRSPRTPDMGQEMYTRGCMGNHSPRTPEMRCVSCGKEAPPQVSLPSSPQSPDDNCSPVYGMGMSRSRSAKDGRIPHVRVFVCGNSAPDLANMILCRSHLHQTVPQDPNMRMFRFSLKQYENSDIIVDLWQKRKNGSRDQFRVMNGTGYFNTSTSSTCVQCGGDGTSVNVELFVIQDENFFHHCSHYLFTSQSIFLIAFNAQRILTNMASDINRLEQLIHTIHSHVGSSARIDVYGVLASEMREELTDDEVRTMFYANDKKLGKYSVSIPQITFITRLNMPEKTSNLCGAIFNWAYSRDQKKSQVTENVECICEVLSGLEHESRTVWNIEELRQRIAVVAPQYKDHILQADVLSLLEQMGCIKCTTAKSGPYQETSSLQDYFVHPVTIQKRLECLCVASKDEIDGELMLALSTTGVLPWSELSSLLINIVPDVNLFISSLQALGVVYDVGPADHRCDRALFIPYFLEDVTGNEPQMTSDICLMAVFDNAVPWTVFYHLASALGQRPECQNIRFSTLRFCVITLQDITLNLQFVKMKDRIVITQEKGGNSAKETIILQLVQELLAHIIPANHHYILGPPCPLGDNHAHVPGHVINLTSAPIRCGSVCLDNDSKVKRWITAEKQLNVEDYLSRNILKLPPGVFQGIFEKLLINQNNDWRTLAGRMNKTSGDVEMYEGKARYTGEMPSKLLLVDWAHMEGGTIRHLLEHLTAMERYDVRSILTEYLNIPTDD